MQPADSSHSVETVRFSNMPSGVELTTKVHRYGGDSDGPAVYVQAAQHGREVNGTEVIRRVHERLDRSELLGELIMVPVADPITFDRVSYTTPEAFDMINTNMNRIWPGDEEGTLHERMAARLWEIAGTADAIIDLHTGTPEIVDHVVVRGDHAPSVELGERFGIDLLVVEDPEQQDRDWPKKGADGMLHVVGPEHDIATITPELAHNKQIVESAVEAGVRGVFNSLRHLGVLSGEPESVAKPRRANKEGGLVEAVDSGLYRLETDKVPGDMVEEGEHIGTVYDPSTFETVQEAIVPFDGILTSLEYEATKVAGDRLLGVARLEE